MTEQDPILGMSDLPPEPPAWPRVIGITSIVIGSIMSGCGACGLASFAMQGRGTMPQGVTPPPSPPPMAAAMQVAGFLLALLLLVAGILLTMRKEPGRWAHLIYAIIAVPMGVLGMVVQSSMVGVMKQWIRDNPSMEKMQDFILLSVYLGFAVGVLLFGYNVFLLVWFIVKRKADLGHRALRDII
jgi:hypothetical protein